MINGESLLAAGSESIVSLSDEVAGRVIPAAITIFAVARKVKDTGPKT